MNEKLAFNGKIIEINPIPGADFIVSATVVCGPGGKWKGVVRKSDFDIGAECLVFLPDALIPEDTPGMAFMEKSGWRVRMQKFKGAPSEVVITRQPTELIKKPVGFDATEMLGVKKYFKPISPNLQGVALGAFPGFIPKTDELNYQMHFDLVEKLQGLPYYITEKCDGSSTTAYKHNGHFGVCSRNLELIEAEGNGYWQVANKYNLRENLPDGIALQWETCGPGIQSNHMGLLDIQGFAFSAYDIVTRQYLSSADFILLCHSLGFPTCEFLEAGMAFDKASVETLGEGKYKNGSEREGVVVRSQDNIMGNHPISFKVINLNYEK